MLLCGPNDCFLRIFRFSFFCLSIKFLTRFWFLQFHHCCMRRPFSLFHSQWKQGLPEGRAKSQDGVCDHMTQIPSVMFFTLAENIPGWKHGCVWKKTGQRGSVHWQQYKPRTLCHNQMYFTVYGEKRMVISACMHAVTLLNMCSNCPVEILLHYIRKFLHFM